MKAACERPGMYEAPKVAGCKPALILQCNGQSSRFRFDDILRSREISQSGYTKLSRRLSSTPWLLNNDQCSFEIKPKIDPSRLDASRLQACMYTAVMSRVSVPEATDW